MIDSIQLQNYKAFSDVEIPLRPLTILLGANNAGKSSIIQMLMLLHQTAEEKDNPYSSALKIYGNHVNAGDYEYLFKDRIINRPLRIQMKFVSNSLVDRIKAMKNSYFSKFERLNERLSFMFNIFEHGKVVREKVSNDQDIKSYVNNVIEIAKDVRKEKKEKEHIYQYFQFSLSSERITEKELRSRKRIYKVIDSFTKLEESCNDGIIIIEYELQLIQDRLTITGLKISTSDLIRIFEIKLSPQNGTSVESDIFVLDKEENQLVISYFRQNQTVFDCIDNIDSIEKVESHNVLFIVHLLKFIIGELRENFMRSNFFFVSPLRAHPKRYYMLDKAKTTISLDTLDGDQIAEVLKDNKTLKSKVNEWFKNFGLEIDVTWVKEVIHHLKVSQNGLTLDITDVGFGISQVLPIIIQGFLSSSNSITIIEQPEIHLHPRIQADLGDLFIDIVKDQNKKLVIETHSEYLLKRIRRRISEGAISPNDVSICLFHAKTEERDAWVELLEIGEKGDFKWPEEYYGGELAEDTFVFLKNQA